jgi:hypothetical protein
MDKITEMHLKEINSDSLYKWKSQLFTTFAACSSKGKYIQLGITGNGKFAIKVNDELTKYRDSSSAITAYYSLVS